MWSRHQLRIKAMQHLFAYGFQREAGLYGPNTAEARQAKQVLLAGLQKEKKGILDAYTETLYLLSRLGHVAQSSEGHRLFKKAKWHQIKAIAHLSSSAALQHLMRSTEITLSEAQIKQVYTTLITPLPLYKTYQKLQGAPTEELQALEKKLLTKVIKILIDPSSPIGRAYAKKDLFFTSNFLLIRKLLRTTLTQLYADQADAVPQPEQQDAQASTASKEAPYCCSPYTPPIDQQQFREAEIFFQELVGEAADRWIPWSRWIQERVPKWDWQRMLFTDIILILLGLAELSQKNGATPFQIIIHEYMEIAKAYSSDKSPPFINALLDKFRQELIPPATQIN